MEPNSTSTPLRVLIVEDVEDDAILMVRELRRAGYDVRFERVETPQFFSAMLAQENWDVILCDYTMPYFKGFQALEIFKKSGRDIPLIFVSGTMSQETAMAAVRAGARDYVMKDNLKRLAATVDREIREAAARRETHDELQKSLAELRRVNEELVQSQQAIETQRESYLELFEEAPVAYLVTDLDGRIQQANHAASTMLNVAHRLILGEPLILFFAEEERKIFHDHMLRARSGEKYRCVSRVQPRERDAFHAAITVASAKERPDRLFWIVHDLSDRV